MILTADELIDHLGKSQPRGFIVFEGINGAGKSTLITAASSYLHDKQREHICTREPGGTELGLRLREILLEAHTVPKSGFAEMLLFSADRAQHLAQIILPAIEESTLVLCDRYLYSTTAFQGFGRRIDRKFIAQCHSLATRGVEPDFVVLLDIEPALALARASGRASSERDAFEEEEISFHTRVRNGFLEQARDLATPFLVLDATREPSALRVEVERVLQHYCL